ncbi:hypothetical protein ATY41_06960 [Leifsonia xyli subsp. xyli]|uniref:Uncharacterized protein n=1 Tax=Leifsonia xyli subsp. xyli TaxID=59736 RepID=A0A1E2SN06_LEIXY|nr:hypothetical protein ATY41_06960 [Leifsonia xyli subsp. xyli]
MKIPPEEISDFIASPSMVLPPPAPPTFRPFAAFEMIVDTAEIAFKITAAFEAARNTRTTFQQRPGDDPHT